MVDRVDHIVDVILQDEANVFSQSIVVFSYINLLILHEGPSCRVLITTIIIVLSALIWLLLNICIRIVSRGNWSVFALENNSLIFIDPSLVLHLTVDHIVAVNSFDNGTDTAHVEE